MFEVRALPKSSRKDRIERGAAQEGPGCRGRSLPGSKARVALRPGPFRTDARKLEYLSGLRPYGLEKLALVRRELAAAPVSPSPAGWRAEAVPRA
jgi:hypothetical protein